ncbi:ComEC/Rec2 family competence protein [Clostridium formicaceticum]|uniref:ComEC family competence protein n=1 Tax=Clostridium formicaceticum TaxID=1497 RepID=A0AAC9WGS4_9CLOT|nr:ComEC/Rec2 family competence protein [Clostridium formicaceticum]AOY77578.1 hypothetical protein BJL90_17985 [Clostridium formicaceticum]ARE88156.1 ComEC family competence protein [Clostridium formicaceticum]
MRRPFVVLCISVVTGIMLGYLFGIFLRGRLLIGFLIIFLLCMLFFDKYLTVFVSISFVILGNFIMAYHMQDTTLLRGYLEKSMTLQGKVEGLKTEGRGYIEYDIMVLKLMMKEEEISIKERAKLRIKSVSASDINLQPGDPLLLKNVLLLEDFYDKTLDGYQKYLRGKGFKSILLVGPQDLERIEAPTSFSILSSSYKAKKYMEDLLDASLELDNSNLLKSIMFGNQGYLARETLEFFSKSGTAHIIAVSGLHIGIIVLFTHKLLNFLKLHKKNILLTTMAVLFFYSYMVNFPVSIVRASSMYYLYVFAFLLQRKYDPINSLTMVAFLLLLYNPFNLFSVSFQLSFMATLSILLFYPLMGDLLKLLPTFLQSLIALTLCAQIGTIPIVAYHFQEVSLVAIAANIFIVPMLGPLLYIAFFSIFLSFISVEAAYLLNFFTNWILNYIYWAVEKVSVWSISTIVVENMNVFYGGIYYIMVFGIYLMIWYNKQNKLMIEKE